MRQPQLCIAILSVILASGQTRPAFEVASIKRSTGAASPIPGWGRMSGGPGTTSPGQFTSTGNSLSNLLFQTAYQFMEYQYAAPPWMGKELYDVVAKVPPGTTSDQFREMLAKLLVDRFQIKYHHEQREMVTYELTVAKEGVKMKPSEVKDDAPLRDASSSTLKLERDAEGFFKVPPGPVPMTTELNLRNVRIRGEVGDFGSINRQSNLVTNRYSMVQLADYLQRNLKHPVLDKTDLKGNWAFMLHFLPISDSDSTAGAASSSMPEGVSDIDVAPTVSQALERQLGLKLTRKKGPVDVMVIDSAAKSPVEN